MTMDEIKKGPHISFSQVNTYLMCPLKYRFCYRERLPMPFLPSTLVTGSAMHETIATYYQSHLEGNVIAPDDMIKIFQQYWAAEEEKSEIRFNGRDRDSTFGMAEKLIQVFHEKASPQNVIAIEEPFRMPIGDSCPDLVGVVDLIESDGASIVIVDLKTASKRKSDQELLSDLQMTAYSLGVTNLGYDKNVLLRFDVLLKQKTPDLVKQYTTRSDNDRERLVKLIKAVWAGIEKEVFYPNHSFMCSSCPYGEPCSEW